MSTNTRPIPANQQPWENIAVDVATSGDRLMREAFWGRWLMPPDDENRWGYDAGTCDGVAETKNGRLALYMYHCNGQWLPEVLVYEDMEAAAADDQPPLRLGVIAHAWGDDRWTVDAAPDC